MNSSMMKLKELCENYLTKFNNRRNFDSRISNAIDKDNSRTKKLCLTLIKDIFEDEKDPYHLFLNEKELSDKLLELIIKGIKEEIEFNTFKLQLFSLSIDLEFVYKISESYYHCFSKNTNEYWGQYLNLYIFQKKFKSEYINNLLNKIGIKYNVKAYDEFLAKIKSKYNKSNDFNEELKNIFVEQEDKIESIIPENKNEMISDDKEQNSEKSNNNRNENSNKSDNEITSQNSKLIIGQTMNEEYENNVEKNTENNKINEEEILKDENNSNIIIDNNIHNLELYKDKNSEINPNLENNEIIQINSEKNNEEIEIIKINYTVYNYLNDQFNKYKNIYKKFVTPVLKNILRKSEIYFSNIGYYDKKKFSEWYKINDKTLSILINDKLNLNNVMCDPKEYGYFCYDYVNPRTKRQFTVEALYSIIDPVYLYNYCRLDNLKDNYDYPSFYIRNFYVKNRAMALEYYINISVFKEKYKMNPLPRIIFPLYNKNFDYELLNEVELDGVFFVEDEFSILDNDLPFIFQNFLSFSGSNKVYEISNESNIKYNLCGKTFKKNDLCLIEIKTEFPEKFKEGNKETLPEVLKKMLEKMIIFEQLFTSLNIKYNRIRLILFYDLVLKTNYTNVIQNALSNFAEKHNELKYLDKICFQVIYVNASYFVGALRTSAEEINNLKQIIENLKIDLQKRDEKIEELTKKNNEISDKYNELISEKNRISDKYNEISDKYNELISEKNKISDKYNELLIKNNELISEKNKISDKNNQLLFENQKLMSKISEQNETIINLQKINSSFEQRIKDLEEKFQQLNISKNYNNDEQK